jgi:hypothetical protein
MALDPPKCAVSMQSFWAGKFQMDQGTYITASIEAENDKGWSTPSRWNISGAEVQKVPSMMNPPSAKRTDDQKGIELEWYGVIAPRDGGSDLTTYVLEYTDDAEPSAADWDTLYGTDDGLNDYTGTTATHDGAGNQKLWYRIAAKNRWGTGPFSKPKTEVEVAEAPEQISSVKVNDAGMVRITWEEPDNTGGSIVESYEVQIKNSNGFFEVPNDGCQVMGDDITDSVDQQGNKIWLCRLDMDQMET